jgi:hypothetical protein
MIMLICSGPQSDSFASATIAGQCRDPVGDRFALPTQAVRAGGGDVMGATGSDLAGPHGNPAGPATICALL